MDLYSRGEFVKSKQVFTKLIAITSNNNNYQYVLGYARVLFQLKSLNDAEQQYRNALNINSSDGKVHYELGLLLFNSNRLTEAGDFIVNALQLSPDNLEYNYQYGLILEELNDF